jgi:hypothetical protein
MRGIVSRAEARLQMKQVTLFYAYQPLIAYALTYAGLVP